MDLFQRQRVDEFWLRNRRWFRHRFWCRNRWLPALERLLILRQVRVGRYHRTIWIRLTVVAVLLRTSSAPDAVTATSTPIGISDARQIKAGAVAIVEAALMIADVVNEIAVMIGDPRALTAGRNRHYQAADCGEEQL